MNDDETHLSAVADTLERLQIQHEDLLFYVLGLRERYASCVEALRNIEDLSDDEIAAKLARDTLIECGALEEDVSHETN